MASPAHMQAYYANAPKAPRKNATPEEKAAYDKANAEYQAKMGHRPRPLQ